MLHFPMISLMASANRYHEIMWEEEKTKGMAFSVSSKNDIPES